MRHILYRCWRLGLRVTLGPRARDESSWPCLVCGVIAREASCCVLPPPLCERILSKRSKLSALSSLAHTDPRWIHLIIIKRGGAPEVLYQLTRQLSAQLAPAIVKAWTAERALIYEDYIREGQKREGQKSEGQKSEGQKSDGQKSEGQKSEGLKSEGQKSEGQKREGQKREMWERYIPVSREREAPDEREMTCLICPIPARRASVLKRGLSPQHIFASALEDTLLNLSGSMAYDHVSVIDLLRRVHVTPRQRHLTRLERTRAQRGSLCVPPRLQSLVERRVIILVDDVTTTGGTLIEGARALSAAGAYAVIGVTMFAVTRSSDIGHSRQSQALSQHISASRLAHERVKISARARQD